MTSGELVFVDVEPARGFVAAAVASGATTLTVAGASLLPADLAEVSINGATYDVSSLTLNDDEDLTGSLVLDSPLVGDVELDEPVLPIPESSVTYALVAVVGDSEPTRVLVPQSDQDMTSLTLGQREYGQGEQVEFERRERGPELTWIEGRVERDGSYIDPGTLPPSEPWGPDEPATAPVVTVTPHAAGAVQADWEPFVDAQAYRVHASLTSPVPLDGSALIGPPTSGTRITISDLGGVPLPLDGSPVYVRVEPVNPNGVGPASVEASAAPRPADDLISALYAYLGRVEATQIDAGEIDADIAWVGGKLTVGDENAAHITFDPAVGQILYGPDGVTPIIEIRIDGQPSVFRGRVIADDVSVLNGVIMQGTQSTVATNARVTLQASVPDPGTKPSLSVGPESRPFAAPPSGYTERGLWWDASGNQWVQLLWNATASQVRYRVISTAGVASATIRLTFTGALAGYGVSNCSGVAFWRGRVWALINDATYRDWYLVGNNIATGDPEVVWGTYFVYVSGMRPTLGVSSDDRLLVAEPTTSDVAVYSFSATNTLESFTTLDDAPFSSGVLTFVGRGSFNYGGTRIVVGEGANLHLYNPTTSAQTLDTFKPDAGTGTTWDGSNWFTQHNNGTLRRYSSWRGLTSGANRTWWAGVSNAVTSPTARETKVSPLASIAVPDGRYLTITPSPKDSQTTHYGYYIGTGTTEPVRTSLWRFAQTTATSATTATPPTSGTNPPASSTFVAGGSPGEIISQSGGGRLDGLGGGSWPGLDQFWDVEATLATNATPTGTSPVTLDFPAVSFVSPGPTAVWKVKVYADVQISSTIANVIEVLVNGVQLPSAAAPRQLVTQGASGTRLSGVKEWRIEGVAAGTTVNVTARTYNVAAGSNSIRSPHTVMVVERRR